MEIVNETLEYIVMWAILLFESIGVAVILISGIKGIVHYIKRDASTRLVLARGMSLGLEFKIGSEILRTVLVREWFEIGIVAGVIILRAALTFLIQWEIKVERRDGI